MHALTVVFIYLGILNLVGLLLMGLDKVLAIHRRDRIPEAVLFTIAVIGGSIGTLIGMFAFRHKTRHPAFRIGLPLLLLVQIVLIVLLRFSPVEIVFM